MPAAIAITPSVPRWAGDAAAADRVVITSDNPRSEDPDAIIGEVVAGIPTADRGRVTSITDRRMAIGEAIGSATLGAW